MEPVLSSFCDLFSFHFRTLVIHTYRFNLESINIVQRSVVEIRWEACWTDPCSDHADFSDFHPSRYRYCIINLRVCFHFLALFLEAISLLTVSDDSDFVDFHPSPNRCVMTSCLFSSSCLFLGATNS